MFSIILLHRGFIDTLVGNFENPKSLICLLISTDGCLLQGLAVFQKWLRHVCPLRHPGPVSEEGYHVLMVTLLHSP